MKMECSTKECTSVHEIRVCLKCYIPLCIKCQKLHTKNDHIFNFPRINHMAEYCDLHNQQYSDFCMECDSFVCGQCVLTGHSKHQHQVLYALREHHLRRIKDEETATSRRLKQIKDEIEKREKAVNKIASEVESKLDMYTCFGRNNLFTRHVSYIKANIQNYLKELKKGGQQAEISAIRRQTDKLKICGYVYKEIHAWQKHITDSYFDHNASIIEKCRLYNDFMDHRILIPPIPNDDIPECQVTCIEPSESEIENLLFRIYVGNEPLVFTDKTISTRTEPTTITREDNCNKKHQEHERTIVVFQETLESMCYDIVSLIDACKENRERLQWKTLPGPFIGKKGRNAVTDFTKLLSDVFSLFHQKNTQWEEGEKEIGQLKSQLADAKKENLETRVRTRDHSASMTSGQFYESQDNTYLRDRLHQSETEHRHTRHDVERLKSLLQDLEEKLRVTERDYERRIEKKNNEIEDLKNRLSNRDLSVFAASTFEKSNEEARITQERIKHAEELKELRDHINTVKADKKESENRLNECAAQHGRTQQEVGTLKSRLKEIEKKLMWTESQLAIVKEDLQKAENDYKTTVEKLRNTEQDHKKEIDSRKKEIDDLKNRLSQVAGAKLTKGNSSIADLGDRFRPTRIAEMYSEMYDNEWTEAVDVLMEKYKWDEDTVVHHLFFTLQACYEACCGIATDEIYQLVKVAFRHVPADEIEDYSKLHTAEIKQLYDTRKAVAVDAAKFVAKDITKTKAFADVFRRYNGVENDLVNQIISQPYFDKCTTVCWLMVVQDPPMVIDRDIPKDTVLDKELYRPYTKSGSRISFSVLPALFLHEGGPLLLKGVAQLY